MPPIKGVKRGPYRKVPVRHRFLDGIGPANETGCWLWSMGLNPQGYGKIDKNLAHRVSYEAFIGPIPEGKFVLHNCDNPPCVNPRHLRIGTQSDNMQDVKNKRRFWSKLTPDQVQAIRASNGDASTIASRFGITSTHVYRIWSRESWGYL